MVLHHSVDVTMCVCSPRAPWLFACSTSSNSGTFWDYRSGKMVGVLKGQPSTGTCIRVAAFSHDGAILVTCDDLKCVSFWEMD